MTQCSQKTGALMIVQEDRELGILIMICDGRVILLSMLVEGKEVMMVS